MAAKDGDSLGDTLRKVHIHDAAISESGSNPWQDEPSAIPVANEHRDPDLSQLDVEITQGIAAAPSPESPHRSPVKREVLLEFDPLANAEDQAAQQAWASSEGHPPPPPPPAPLPLPEVDQISQSPPSQPSTPNRPSSPIPAFPALAALARTFALPLTRGQRPRSLDSAAAVPSPATLSSFAKQQYVPATRPPDDAPSTSGDSDPAVGSGRSSPSGKDQDAPLFDFQKFLDQMKLKAAEPVAKYLRSFLSNFAKRTFTVNDQVKLINDFLNFISVRMRESEVWRHASDAEFDNAMEGMEKLVMNRLYEFTFTPQVARAVPPRPVTTDDLERDRVLAQRIALFRWIEVKHLDVPEGEGSEGFLMFAQQELLKINHYKAPRDKLICILNCCKVIFGLIRHLHKDESADTFIPILIYIVIKANPSHLLSNVEFINRFRTPTKLQSEAGYYLSSLMGAVSFIETMDHTSLSNITQEEFEKNVEEAIQSLPSTGTQTPERSIVSGPESSNTPLLSSASTSHVGEESAQPLSLPAPMSTLGEDARRLLQKTGSTISKPLNAIGRIFNEVLDGAEDTLSYLPGPFAPLELSREQQQQQQYQQDGQVAYPHHYPQTSQVATVGGYQPPIQTPYKPRIRRGSPQPSIRSASSAQFPNIPQMPEETPSSRFRAQSLGPHTHQALALGASQSYPGSSPLQPPRVQALVQDELGPAFGPGGQSPHVSRTPTPNLDLAGLQDEIDRAHEKAAVAARETLRQIFPTTDVEVVEWVLEANGGDLGKSIEALLEMSSGT